MASFLSSLNNTVSNLVKPVNQVLNTAGGLVNAANLFTPNAQGFQGLNLGGLKIPSSLLGAGSLLASGLRKDEKGEVIQARQFLRNRFTSPTALSDQFSGQLNALSQQFLPALQQQEQDQIRSLSQRFRAAFPSNVGAQGPEFGSLAKLVSDRFLPQRQRLLGELALNLVNTQGNAARTILDTARPDALNEALGQFGGLLLGSQFLNQPGGTQLLGQNGQSLGSVGPNGTLIPGIGAGGGFVGGLTGFNQAAGAVTQAAAQVGGLNNLLVSQPQVATQVGALLGANIVPDPTGQLTGIPGYAIETSQGVMIPADAVNLDTLGSTPSQVGGAPAATQAGFQGFLGTPGLTSGSGMLSGAAAIGGGAFLGSRIGQFLQSKGNNDTISGLGSAAGGGAAGFSIGGPIGGVIGAIAGGISGLMGASGARSEEKEAAREQERQATAAQRPGVLQTRDATVNMAAQSLPELQAQIPQMEALLRRRERDNRLQALAAQAAALPDIQSVVRPDIINAKFNKAPAKLYEWLVGQIANLNSIIRPDPNNPNSVSTLLNSGEVGHFRPGAQAVSNVQRRIQELQGLLSQTVALAQGA